MTAELALAAPLLLLILLLIVQFAMWSHASHIAQSAAAEGLAAARVHHGTAAAGASRVRDVLADLGAGPLTEPSVTVVRTDEHATVKITGRAAQVIPFVHLTVHATAAGAVERFVPDHVELR